MNRGTFLLLLTTLIATPSFAQTSSKDLKRYIDFATEWTSHHYNGEPLPKIQIERHSIVQIYANGEIETAKAEQEGAELLVVNAVYVPEDKTIYVSDQISPTDPKLEATLVHEIVHYLQDISGYTHSLEGHLSCTESEAYDVQMLWQKINDIAPDEIPFVYQQSLLAATRCMGNKATAIGASFASKKGEAEILTRR